MHSTLLFAALSLVTSVRCQGPSSSPKRGLVFVPGQKQPDAADVAIWDSPTSDLTWYYNYDYKPSPPFSGSKLQFVPQLWGKPASDNDTTFLDAVTAQIKGGANVSYVLTFNEPDGTSSTGGSNIDPQTAAQIWIREVEPLAKMGVKLGAPACTGAESGRTWTQNFFNACSNCTIDFVPVHWYGNFEGLASHVGEYVGTFNRSVWVTEFADAHADLKDSQTFYNQSSQFLDRSMNVTYYSYFGAFRSDVSNVGANAAMLTQKGKLTDIGSWYLGGTATGNVPSAAGRNSIFAGYAFVVALISCWSLL